MRCVLHAQLSLFKIHITDSLDYSCSCVKYEQADVATYSIVGFVCHISIPLYINQSDFSVYLYTNASVFWIL